MNEQYSERPIPGAGLPPPIRAAKHFGIQARTGSFPGSGSEGGGCYTMPRSGCGPVVCPRQDPLKPSSLSPSLPASSTSCSEAHAPEAPRACWFAGIPCVFFLASDFKSSLKRLVQLKPLQAGVWGGLDPAVHFIPFPKLLIILFA